MVLNVVAPVTARVEEPVIAPEVFMGPETKREVWIVEEAWENNPPAKVESPVTERVDPSWEVPEAVKVPAVFREPEVKRREAKVEEDCAKRFVKVESPFTAKEEEAEIAPPT